MADFRSNLITRMTDAEKSSFAAVDGKMIYNLTNNVFEFRQNGTWIQYFSPDFNKLFELEQIPLYTNGTEGGTPFTTHAVSPSDLGLTDAGVRKISVCCSNGTKTNLRAQHHYVEYNSTNFLNITSNSIEDLDGAEIIIGSDSGLDFTVTVVSNQLSINEQGDDDIERLVISVSPQLIYTSA